MTKLQKIATALILTFVIGSTLYWVGYVLHLLLRILEKAAA